MEEKQTTLVKKPETTLVESVVNRVALMETSGMLQLPKDYSAANACRSAWLILQDQKYNDRPVLEVCTRESVANAMLNMVTQGLNPAKKQCSFIPYGNKLTMQREYPGSIALARRYGGMKDIKAGVIYENDVFEYAIDPKTGRKHITRHDQKLANIDEEKIKGAYAVIEFEDGDTDTEIMTIMQIKKSWAQGKAKGEGPAHKNFAGEMAKKTVIGRACKILIASSDDSVLLESESDSRIEKAKAQIESEENKGEVIEIPEEIIDPNITTTSSTVPLTQNPYPHETPPLSILNQETPLDQSEKNLTPPEEPNKTSKNKSNRKADF